MTIREIVQKHNQIEIDILLEHVLKKPKEFFYMNPDYALTQKEYTAFERLAKKREAGTPVAYLVGYKYFYGIKFKVTTDVLIPRPETEWLVEQALKRVKRGKGQGENLKLLDMGTGSGCVAISIAVNFKAPSPKLKITLSDISAKALVVAKKNTTTYKADIRFIQSDLFKSIRGAYTVIIANLPYVPLSTYNLLYHNLHYEPKIAITDGGEVWEVYRRFFATLDAHLLPGGTALLEIDDSAKPHLSRMLRTILPAYKATFTKDLNGLWRYLTLDKPVKN